MLIVNKCILGNGPKKEHTKNVGETCTKWSEHSLNDAVELMFGKVTVTHLKGVASVPCLIDLRLDHWVPCMSHLVVRNSRQLSSKDWPHTRHGVAVSLHPVLESLLLGG